MKNINRILMGSLIGATIIFFLPIIPVSVPIIDSADRAIWWVNGKYFFDIIKFAWKDFLVIEGTGATMGVLFSLIKWE